MYNYYLKAYSTSEIIKVAQILPFQDILIKEKEKEPLVLNLQLLSSKVSNQIIIVKELPIIFMFSKSIKRLD
jgi:hypothetical protein